MAMVFDPMHYLSRNVNVLFLLDLRIVRLQPEAMSMTKVLRYDPGLVPLRSDNVDPHKVKDVGWGFCTFQICCLEYTMAYAARQKRQSIGILCSKHSTGIQWTTDTTVADGS